jgi:hypothetical protein
VADAPEAELLKCSINSNEFLELDKGDSERENKNFDL